MKAKRTICFILLAALLPAILAVNAACGRGGSPNQPHTTDEPAAPMEELSVSVLKVGKADAIILKTGESCMVIDAGEEDDGAEICAFLEKSGVSRVDALIITHFDKDHVGGADKLIDAFPVERVIMPDYESTAAQYLEFIAALEKKSIAPERIRSNTELSLGTAQVLVEPPVNYPAPSANEETDNDCSLITTVTHGRNRLIFMGDAEKYRLRDWLDGGAAQSCDFIKVPHHGRYNAMLSELFAAVRPKYAVICSSDKNPAEDKTLKLLSNIGAEVYETRFGNVAAISNGISLELSQEG